MSQEALGRPQHPAKGNAAMGVGGTSAFGELIFNIFPALGPFERRLIQEQTKTGMAAARARGQRGGRPQTTPKDAKLRWAKNLMADKPLELDDIFENLKISRSPRYR